MININEIVILHPNCHWLVCYWNIFVTLLENTAFADTFWTWICTWNNSIALLNTYILTMSKGIGNVKKYWYKFPYQNLIIDHIFAWRDQHAGIIDYWSFWKVSSNQNRLCSYMIKLLHLTKIKVCKTANASLDNPLRCS